MGFDWKSLVQSVAPTIATALGGPFVGLGVKALSQAVLGNEEGGEIEIAAALAGASPEMLQSMKDAEFKFKTTMKDLDIKLEDLKAKDRASAREREKILKDKTPAILAYVLSFGFFGIVFALFKYAIPESNREVIYLLVGSLATAWAGAMMYFHGSSSGSARKDILKK